jgi:hypothetical protein
MNNTANSTYDQLVSYQMRMLDILSNINNLVSTDNSYSVVSFPSVDGTSTDYSLPSFGFLSAEINRIKADMKSIFGIGEDGALIQNTGSNEFKRIITLDLNKEPQDIQNLNIETTFSTRNNNFLADLTNPNLYLDIDLNNKIDNLTTRVLVRKYVLNFTSDGSGILTQDGQRALAEFNANYRNNNNILISDFLTWHGTTAGLNNRTNPDYYETIINLEPNTVMYDGVYTVVRLEEDNLNRKVWCVLNTFDYYDLATNEVKQLTKNDELIINVQNSSTRYRVLETNNENNIPRVSLELVEGNLPIPIGMNTMKIYSPVKYTKKVRVNIGFNERCIIFIKSINDNNNIQSRNWSKGLGIQTNDLVLRSADTNRGMTMETFYANFVYDYGEVIQELVSTKIPSKYASTPNSVFLDENNFKVVQINKHLENSTNREKIRKLSSQQIKLKTEIEQYNKSIEAKNKEGLLINFSSETQKATFTQELNSLISKKEALNTQLQTIIQDILELNTQTNSSSPKYRLRGFFDFPEAIVTNTTLPQQVVQFRIEYRYLSVNGEENSLQTYVIDGDKTAVFSNWEHYKTDARNRIFNSDTGEFEWVVVDVSDADTTTINQVDIPISPNEIVEFRVIALSEVGYPDSPVESDPSNTLRIAFPDDLANVISEEDFIINEATKEEYKNNVLDELNSRGLNDLLSQKVTVDNKTFLMNTENIISGFFDDNSNILSLFQLLSNMQNRIKTLEENINRIKGILKISIFHKDKEYEIMNGMEKIFNIQCEDYMDKFQGDNIPNGRVYRNDIYVIQDFYIKISNVSESSPLGLLSSRIYKADSNSDVFKKSIPQVFWVNENHDLLFNNSTGETNTQFDNQFVWACNYSGINSDRVLKLSSNIGNSFNTDGNSLTNSLSSTSYNLGYQEDSLLAFSSNNNSLVENTKWIDNNLGVASTNRFLTTIHPVINDLNSLREINSERVKILNPQTMNDINIPLYIYFKSNSLDNTRVGVDNQYVNYNNAISTIKHTKVLKFLLEKEGDSKPFEFTVKFNLYRNKTFIAKLSVENLAMPYSVSRVNSFSRADLLTNISTSF